MCEEIISHFPTSRLTTENVKMKFSLYLSSQLMYGLVVVYNKQQDYLIADLRRAQELLQTPPFVVTPIDLPNVSLNIDLPDALRVQKKNPLAFIDFGPVRFSPEKESTILAPGKDDDMFSIHTASLLESDRGSQVSSGTAFAPHTVHPSKITLREDLASILRGFEGEDLLPPDEDFYAKVVAMADEDRMEVMTDLTSGPSGAVVTSTVEETPAFLNPPQSPIGQPAPLRASKPKSPEITVAHLEVGPEPEQIHARFRLSPLAPEDEQGHLLIRRGRRDRMKRLKIDKKISLSGGEIDNQIRNYGDTMQSGEDLIINPMRAEHAADSEWFRKTSIPIGSKSLTNVYRLNSHVFYREEIDMDEVWNSPPWTIPYEYRPSPRAAREFIENFNGVNVVDETPLEMSIRTTSMIEQVREMSSRRDASLRETSVARPRPSVIPQQDIEMAPLEGVEIAREQLERESSVGVASLLPPPMVPFDYLVESNQQQGQIDEERDGATKSKRRRVRSPPPKDHLVECFPPAADMPNSDCRTFALQREQLKNTLKEKTAGGRVINFTDLVPLNKTRAQAGKTFYMLLELVGKREVNVEQSRPYGPITIFSGADVDGRAKR